MPPPSRKYSASNTGFRIRGLFYDEFHPFICTAAHYISMSSGRYTMQVPMDGIGPIIRQ
ncbi:hypothetical protein CY34DRAFT_799973 [Suillus luteus UH-Slu-Lm8-n1]|uniref:Uncharacterized protein n=1 Tax=Suillus luteus UH-Slu-Lm8-n1 TaxID=930992 RepID=A0A0D0A9C5_9AGAM|nr:hypothetical protein CY34DRAFT_799973 [Suillus luteus UH-Slu-Lm8-n1]